jgi:hypothetical protein
MACYYSLGENAVCRSGHRGRGADSNGHKPKHVAIGSGFKQSRKLLNMVGQYVTVPGDQIRAWKRRVVVASGYNGKDVIDTYVGNSGFSLCRVHFESQCYYNAAQLASVLRDGVEDTSIFGGMTPDQKLALVQTGTLRFNALPRTKAATQTFMTPPRLSPAARAAVSSADRLDSQTTSRSPAKRMINLVTEVEQLKEKLGQLEAGKVSSSKRRKPLFEGEEEDVLDPNVLDPQAMRVEAVEAHPIRGTDASCKMMTGLQSWKFFHAQYDLVMAVFGGEHTILPYGRIRTGARQGERGRKPVLDLKNQMFFVLYLLATGSDAALACLHFLIDVTTASRYVTTWVRLLAITLRHVQPYPSYEAVQATLPPKWPRVLGNKRMRLILDATEVFMQTPSTKSGNRTTWSDYKHNNTAKFLVGVTPCGAIVFTSDGFGGSLNDVKLVEVSGLLFVLEDGDDVMADKGFMIHHLMGVLGVGLTVPPKAYTNQAQFTAAQMIETERVANMRIHVERAMARIKEFGILQKTIKISQVDLLTDIFTICACIGNYSTALVGDDFHVE